MKPSTKSVWNPSRLDVRAFALAGQTLESVDDLSRFERLTAEALTGADHPVSVTWQCRAEMRSHPSGKSVPWLHLDAKALVSLKCQRCLGPVEEAIQVDRWFRFVADEATAELEDEDSDEDVLALEPRPDMVQLIEDELLMELPLVPMHETCPVAVPMQAGEIDVPGAPPQQRENPFAQLARLKK
jgi:uncharacterized protein